MLAPINSIDHYQMPFCFSRVSNSDIMLKNHVGKLVNFYKYSIMMERNASLRVSSFRPKERLFHKHYFYRTVLLVLTHTLARLENM